MGHLRSNGFKVDDVSVTNGKLHSIKRKYGVPGELAGCHTAVVDGYVVEGHVPAEDILRMLEEKPEIVGLAVPGMPAGSPGMEAPGGRQSRYRVLSFDDQGGMSVYARH